MNFQEKIKEIIGKDIYAKLEKEADIEVSLALKIPLKDQDGQDKYYLNRFLIPVLISECDFFEQKNLKIAPVDIVNILFRCKMLFAVKTENEYHQRVGGGSYVDENKFVIPWAEKSKGINTLIDHYLERLESFQKERTLITEINSFNSPHSNPQDFFDRLLQKIELPFSCYLEESKLIDKYKKSEPHLMEYDLNNAKRYFCSPSFGFTTFGSSTYCYWYASTNLRTLLSLLRIAGFLTPGQIDFGQTGVEIIAPTGSVFIGSHGLFCWDEDKKEPWAKVPDGCLFLSFGYRGVSRMWLDSRTFSGIEKFFLENKKIFDSLKNPWSKQCLNDVAPTLDILSSATQIPDLGVKVLLLYCCLEHLFVPKNIRTDNKKYIVGGINALRSDLLTWFDRLYGLRCTYAHKGFIQRDEKVLGIITESMRNVIKLLVAKLSNS